MNTKQMLHILLGIGLAIFVIPANSANSPVAQKDKAAKQIPIGLWQAFSEAQHLIQPMQSKGTPMRFKGQNPGNGFTFSFDPKGITYRSGSQDKPWQLSMELTGYGTKEQKQAMPTRKLHLDGNRVIYDRGNVQEWYVNNTAGLEQGFTLQAPPSQAIANQQIVLDIKLSGNLSPRWQQKGQSLAFYTEKGDYAFNYAKLSVIDAEGKELPAQMALVDKKLQLSFNPENARWPIIVDPLSYTETKLVGADNDAEANAKLGFSVALHGDTAVIGAPYDDSACVGTETDCGAAYIFTGEENSWMLQNKLIAEDPNQSDLFGHSIALHADTAVIGAYLDDGGCISPELDCGAVYVYTRIGGIWSLQKKLVAEDPDHRDYFGYSVAVHGDSLLVGAYQDNASCIKLEYRCGAAYVFSRSGTKWLPQQKLIAEDADNDDFFGIAVALNGDTAIIGASFDDGNCAGTGINCGAAYVFTRSSAGSSWTQQQKLKAEDASSNDRFGNSVALNNDSIVVGASHHDGSCGGTGINCGAAYVFIRSGSSWVQQQKLVAEDADFDDRFGHSVALNNDTVVIAAPRDNESCSGTDIWCGAAYVFIRSGNSWNQQQKLFTENANDSDNFGVSVALDGNTLIIGADQTDDSCLGTDSNCGTAYVFTRSGNNWVQQKMLLAKSTLSNHFGSSVALDGNTALIGASFDEKSCSGVDIRCGAAYVFTRFEKRWSFQQKLVAEDANGYAEFGTSVSLDGDTALIGARLDGASCKETNTRCGAAYVFIRSGNHWTQHQKLVAEDPAHNSVFGGTVALNGNTLLIGAEFDNGFCISCGSVYIFTRSGNSWSQQQKLISEDGDGFHQFGSAVAIDGDDILIGAAGDDQNCNFGCGAAYVYTRSGNSWTLQQKLVASDSEDGASFGSSTALYGDTLLIGAPSDDGSCQGEAVNCGAAYVFTRSGASWIQQQKIVAEDVSMHDGFRDYANFGKAVALEGDIAVINANNYNELCNEANFECNASYLYIRVLGEWHLQQKFIAGDTPDGRSSISLDKNTFITGASVNRSSCTVGGNNSLCGSAYIYNFDCGFGKGIQANRWTMLGLPCNTNNSTVEDVFGSNMNPDQYGLRWVVYERDYTDPDSYNMLSLSSTLSNQQQGYWILSLDTTTWNANGTATPVVTTNTNCPSKKGCYEINLTPPTLNTDPARFNLIGQVFPFKTEWQDVRFEIDNVPYTPSNAQAAGFVSKNMWLYNGNAYEVFDDSTPGMEGEMLSHEGLWAAVLGKASGSTVKLLVPVENIIAPAPPPPPSL